MPPRFAYWTIIVEGKPTAFRAQTREELKPTFRQLQNKHPDAVMMWFARGRLWAARKKRARPTAAAARERRRPTGGRAASIGIRGPASTSRATRSGGASPRSCAASRAAPTGRRAAIHRETGRQRDRPPRAPFRPREDRPRGRPERRGSVHRGEAEWKPGGDRRDQRKPWAPRPSRIAGRGRRALKERPRPSMAAEEARLEAEASREPRPGIRPDRPRSGDRPPVTAT